MTAGISQSAAEIPDLDDLRGDWFREGDRLNHPAVTNFVGTVQCGAGIAAYREGSFAPLRQLGRDEALTVWRDGLELPAQESRWWPYQVERRFAHDDFTATSRLRLSHERAMVLVDLKFEADREADVVVQLEDQVRYFAEGWSWDLPWAPHSEEPAVRLIDTGILIEDPESNASVAAILLLDETVVSPQVTERGARWQLRVASGHLSIAIAFGASADEALGLVESGVSEFDQMFEEARAGWHQRFRDAFTKGNGHFSGSLPLFDAPGDRRLERVYYMSVLSVLQMERVNLPAFPRAYVTCGPNWSVTSTYLWDLSLTGSMLCRLDPDIVRTYIEFWLEHGVETGYAVDALRGQVVGPWYSANEYSLFCLIDSYVRHFAGPDFLLEDIGGRTVLEHARALAERGATRAAPGHQVADYGGIYHLLEQVPSYVNGVASLNAANVWMLRTTRDWAIALGEPRGASELEGLASELLPAVLDLYEPGAGYWSAVHRDGSTVPVRHVYDVVVAARRLSEDLTPEQRREVVAFVGRELVDGDWMHALAVDDPDAAVSRRADHGSNGCFDAWVGLTAAALDSLGARDAAAEVFARAATVTKEGPFSQAHEIVRDWSGLVVANSDGLRPRGDFQLDVRFRSSLVAPQCVLSSESVGRGPQGLSIRVDADGRVQARVASGARFITLRAQQSIEIGAWIDVSVSLTDRDLSLSVDGVVVDRCSFVGEFAVPTRGHLTLGFDMVDRDEMFDGTIAEIALRSAGSELLVNGEGSTSPILSDRSSREVEGFRIVARNSTVPRIGYWEYLDFNEMCGGAFACTVLDSFFACGPQSVIESTELAGATARLIF